MDIFGVLTMIGGLALFLYGMHVMGDGLAKTSGGKLEQILEKFTSSPMRAVLLGAGVTAVIQSSSATTVMVVGFVNSGIMKLNQAVGIIMGANIGTTVTSWLLSLTGIQGDNLFVELLKPSSFTPILAIVGVSMILFAKSSRPKDIGTIMIGFSVLMFGMDTMSEAVKPLADVPEFTRLFTVFENPILGVIAGTILTAVIQSSSASVGILQALCLTGAVSYSSAIPIIMGQNIGTCITALLSAVGANRNAKRAALVHFYFNLIGTILFMVLFYLLNAFIGFSFMGQAAGVMGIAIVHTCFNVLATSLLLPFRSILVRLATWTIPESAEEKQMETTLHVLDERFLEKPSFAVAQAKTAALQMAEDARNSIRYAIDLFEQYDEEQAKKVAELESTVDHYEDEIGTYLMKIGNAELSDEDSQSVSLILHCIGDFERISDHGVNIMESAQELYEKGLKFSDKALEELRVMEHAVEDIVDIAYKVYENQDVQLAREIEPLEEVIDELSKELKYRHIQRLRAGECTIEMGFILSDVTTSLERVADHCSNIGVCVTQVHEDAFDTHQHLKQIKHGPDETFYRALEVIRSQYQLPEIKDEQAAAQMAAAGSQ